ncbi:MAG: redoxin family protein, partial [Rubricoccaceae bacterium]
RVAELARDYAAPGIGFVAVGSNDPVRFPEESAERARARLEQLGFSFPYVMDEGGALARAFGVRNTPQVFFFSAEGTLLYEGAIDDSPAAEARVTRPYLRQAMDQHLAGLPVEVRQTQAFGCTVRLP